MKDELHFLLQLDGEVFPMDNGYWTKFEVKLVESSSVIPHGIRYSLTLHNAENQRVFGIDNAHLPKLRKKYGAKKVTWDHQHKKDKVVSYEFDSAAQLLEDFWHEVDKVMNEGGAK